MDETRTQAGKEARRRLAVQRVNDGWKQADVAAFLGVHPVTVNKWVRAHRADGDEGLAGKPHPGRTPFLTPAQEKQVLGWLAEKPTAHGFPTDLWTARRVADLIRRRFGVEYHPNYLREWMTKRNLSPQKPEKWAKERDLKEVGRWLAEDWPAIQNATVSHVKRKSPSVRLRLTATADRTGRSHWRPPAASGRRR